MGFYEELTKAQFALDKAADEVKKLKAARERELIEECAKNLLRETVLNEFEITLYLGELTTKIKDLYR